MKKFLFIFFLLLFFNSFSTCFAFSVYNMSNGQTLIVKEIHDNPIVTIDTWIKTGSINETEKNSGVAHFLEHLFFKGTNKYPTGQFDKILESKGAINNAATSKDFTHYYITIPSNEFEKALELHSDMLLNPLIPRKEMEMERKVVLEEISKNNDNPQRKLFNNLNELLYSRHPYARKVIGKKEVIETITREEIMKFYSRYYIPSNMITVIVGDVNKDDVRKNVEKYFVTTNKNKPEKNNYAKDKLLTKQVEKIVLDDVKTGYTMIGFRGVDYRNKKDSYALDVLSVILGDGKTSRLYNNVKDKKQLVNSIYSGHSSFKEDSLFVINANFKAQNYNLLKDEIFREIKRLKDEEISDTEIEKAKKMIERDTYYSRESGANIASEIGYMTLIWETPGFYNNYLTNIRKVTSKDLNRVAKKYLKYNRAAISTVLPRENECGVVKKEKNKILNADSVQNVGDISKYKLKNGATLLINNNTLNDIVAIKIYSIGGAYLEKIPGLSSMLASCIMRGTKSYSFYDFSKLLEENGIRISPSYGGDFFSLSLKFTKNEMDLSFNLLEEMINDATFNPFEIEKVKSEKIASIKKSRDIPSNLAFEEFKTKIWENNPYGYTSKILEKNIHKIEQKDLFDFYSKVFSPQNLVISINGNVDPQRMVEYFSNVFKSSNSDVINLESYKQLNKKIEKTEDIKIDSNVQTAWYIIGWQVNGLNNFKEYATLKLINSILGTGMSSRLFVNLRDEQGLAYQVSSFYTANVNHGIFGAYIGTNPKNYSVAKNDILKEIFRFKNEFVSEKELKEAKDKLLGNYLLSQETNMEKASQLGWFEASGRGFQFEKEYLNVIKSITSTDIINVANKYFNENYLNVTVAPLNELK